jgi:hypothetical protein
MLDALPALSSSLWSDVERNEDLKRYVQAKPGAKSPNVTISSPHSGGAESKCEDGLSVWILASTV